MQITYSTPFAAGEIMSQFQKNQELIKQSGLKPNVNNIVYTPARWLGRILDPDTAFRPNDLHWTCKANYLHSHFELDKLPNHAYQDSETVFRDARKVFAVENVVKQWMSSVFGFFEQNGNVVQINPADLFLYNLYWNFPFDYALKNARVIDIESEGGDEFVAMQLGYYLLAFTRQEPYEHDLSHWQKQTPVLKTNDQGAMYGVETMVDTIPCATWRQSWLIPDLRNKLKFMKDKPVSKVGFLNNLPTLGEVSAFGYSQQFQVEYAHCNLYEEGEYENYTKYESNGYSLKRFAQGMWKRQYTPVIRDKSALTFVSEERDAVNKLLTRLYKANSSHRARKTEVIDEVIKLGIYPPTTIAKKSWFKDNFMKDAAAMDWILKEVRIDVIEDDSTESKKVRFIEMLRPKSGRRS